MKWSSRTKLLGIEPKVQQQQHATQAEANRLVVRSELQADCFAGAGGHNMQQQGYLETGDLREALNAAERPSATIAYGSRAGTRGAGQFTRHLETALHLFKRGFE